MKSFQVRLAEHEERRFGVRTARAENVSETDVPAVLEFCSTELVRLLIARCGADDIPATAALQRAGALLMETQLDYRHDLTHVPHVDPPPGIELRTADERDKTGLERVAAASFASLPGHYHADPRLDDEQCREAYVDWIGRTIAEAGPDEVVVVAEADGEVCAFLAGRLLSPEEGLLFIGAVSPAVQGRGVFRSVAADTTKRFSDLGARTLTGATQVTNFPVQMGFVSVGYRPFRAYHTFHAWFD